MGGLRAGAPDNWHSKNRQAGAICESDIARRHYSKAFPARSLATRSALSNCRFHSSRDYCDLRLFSLPALPWVLPKADPMKFGFPGFPIAVFLHTAMLGAITPNEWRFRQTIDVPTTGLVRINVPVET